MDITIYFLETKKHFVLFPKRSIGHHLSVSCNLWDYEISSKTCFFRVPGLETRDTLPLHEDAQNKGVGLIGRGKGWTGTGPKPYTAEPAQQELLNTNRHPALSLSVPSKDEPQGWLIQTSQKQLTPPTIWHEPLIRHTQTHTNFKDNAFHQLLNTTMRSSLPVSFAYISAHRADAPGAYSH